MKTLLVQVVAYGMALVAPAIVWEPANAYEVKEVKDGGMLSGVVVFSGKPPPLEAIPVSKDAQACGHGTKPSPRLVVSEGKGVANTVIRIVDVQAGRSFDASDEPYVLDQKGCVFVPHIQVVPLRAKLSIKNNDAVLHNVHGFLEDKTVFNLALAIQGQVVKKRLKTPGTIRFQCDAGHVWMSAYVIVTEHPYVAITDDRGRYEIKDIPPGTYTVEVWHEGWYISKRLSDGTIVYSEPNVLTKEVTIEAGKTTTLDHRLSDD